MLAHLGKVIYWAGCVAVELSGVSCAHKQTAKPEVIDISVDYEGKIYWNGQPVTCEEVNQNFTQ